jgi:plastocyanin
LPEVIRRAIERRTGGMRRFAWAVVAATLLSTPARAGTLPVPATSPTVHIHNFAFVPATLAVAGGTVVTFVNDDAEPHTVTAVNGSYDSEALDTRASWAHTFAVPGASAYFCELHPMMKGRIIVQPVSK